MCRLEPHYAVSWDAVLKGVIGLGTTGSGFAYAGNPIQLVTNYIDCDSVQLLTLWTDGTSLCTNMSLSKNKVMSALEAYGELRRPITLEIQYWEIIGPSGRILNSFRIIFESMTVSLLASFECPLCPSMNFWKVYGLL